MRFFRSCIGRVSAGVTRLRADPAGNSESVFRTETPLDDTGAFLRVRSSGRQVAAAIRGDSQWRAGNLFQVPVPTLMTVAQSGSSLLMIIPFPGVHVAVEVARGGV
jgi:hypothetical protein